VLKIFWWKGSFARQTGFTIQFLANVISPTFGGFYLGLEIGREDKFPEWAARDLMDRASKK